jgi:acetyltransferase-like isoleucine patch superfamily enzyme
MAGDQGREAFSSATMVSPIYTLKMNRLIKGKLSPILSLFLRVSSNLREKAARLINHALLSSRLTNPLGESVVVLGKSNVYGTGNIRVGDNVLLYPNLHLETQGDGSIEIGDNVVLSTNVHLVSMAKVKIGRGSLIGEFTSIRDANHTRLPGQLIRNADHEATPITIGDEVWIGRGVTILAGTNIGDGATVGANAVVTSDVPAGITVVGIPARPIRGSRTPRPLPHDLQSIEEDQPATDDLLRRGPNLGGVASQTTGSTAS